MTRRGSALLLSAASLLLAVVVLLLLPLRRPDFLTRYHIPAGADSLRLTAGPRYQAGALRRFFQGDGYRALWTEPVAVEVLRLGEADGGLTPLREGGGRETRSLHLRSRDGRRFIFRSIDKEIVRLLSPRLHRSLLAALLQDHVSAAHPAAPLVAAPLQAALGLPAPHPRLVVLADSGLGAFTARFAGLLGVLQEAPEELARGLPGAATGIPVLDSQELFALLDRAGGDRIDARGFLTARLLDFVLNDWDRHQGQWRWVARAEAWGTLWQPIPTDRDQAFARYDGLLLALARLGRSRLSMFGPQYPSLASLTRNSRDLNQRILRGLPRTAWDSIAGSVRDRLTDGLIDSAVRRMPEPWWRLSGAALADALKQRRAGLADVATRFYEMVSAGR